MALTFASRNLGGMEKRLLGLIIFRILTVTIMLGSTALLHHQSGEPWSLLQSVIFNSIGMVFTLTILYLLAVKYNSNMRLQAIAQIFGDLLFWSFLIYLTDGLHSPFTFLYTLSIIHGSILLGRRGAYITFILASIMFSILIWMESHGIFHELLVLTPSFIDIMDMGEIYQLFLNFTMLLLISVLTGNLAEQISSQEELLTHQRMTLQLQRMLNRSIVAGISAGFVMVDLSGKITFFNVGAEKISGVSFAEARERFLWEIFPDLEEPIARERRGENWSRRMEMKIQDATSPPRYFSVSFSDLSGPENNIVGTMIVIDEITEKRKLEEKVFRTEKLVAVGKLAAGIAHEIRNPLASISGSIQMLRSEMPPGDDNRKLMEIVIRETDRLNSLINDFLSFARPRPLTLSMVNIREIIEDISELILSKNPEIRLRMEYTDDLPDLVADAGQVRQMLWNVLQNGVNALQGISPGVIWISVSGEEQPENASEKTICFLIRDNGHGMSEKTIEKIFDPFFTTKQEGTGLGMSIVYQAIQAHGGSIEVDSELGRGSSFSIILPCRRQEDVGSMIGKG